MYFLQYMFSRKLRGLNGSGDTPDKRIACQILGNNLYYSIAYEGPLRTLKGENRK